MLEGHGFFAGMKGKSPLTKTVKGLERFHDMPGKVGCWPGRYVTEGVFRASHRAEADPSNDPRAAAHLPGTPFHSFTAAAAQPLAPGEAGLLRFQMMPTAYRFAKVCFLACPPARTVLTCTPPK
jgi:hypothetical protein